MTPEGVRPSGDEPKTPALGFSACPRCLIRFRPVLLATLGSSELPELRCLGTVALCVSTAQRRQGP